MIHVSLFPVCISLTMVLYYLPYLPKYNTAINLRLIRVNQKIGEKKSNKY